MLQKKFNVEKLHTRTLTSDHDIVGKYNAKTSLENLCAFNTKTCPSCIRCITHSFQRWPNAV